MQHQPARRLVTEPCACKTAAVYPFCKNCGKAPRAEPARAGDAAVARTTWRRALLEALRGGADGLLGSTPASQMPWIRRLEQGGRGRIAMTPTIARQDAVRHFNIPRSGLRTR